MSGYDEALTHNPKQKAMQAFITEGGSLLITPDNETEAYALRVWKENSGELVAEWHNRIIWSADITPSQTS